MDFSKQRYNVDEAVKQEKTMLEVYPDLSNYEEFADEEQDVILKIMFLMADIDSPFIKAYRDEYELRLVKVYSYLSLTSYDSDFNDILAGKHNQFNAMLYKWFMLSDNLAYQSWYSTSMNFHYYNAFLRQIPDFDSDKHMETRGKIEKAKEEAYTKLIALEKAIFPDARARKIVKEEVAKIDNFPERLAQDKEDEFGKVRVI